LTKGRTYTLAVALVANKTARVYHSEKIKIDGVASLMQTPSNFNFDFVKNANGGFRINLSFDDPYATVTQVQLSYGTMNVKAARMFNGYFYNIVSKVEKDYEFTATIRYRDSIGNIQTIVLDPVSYSYKETVKVEPTNFKVTLNGNEDETFDVKIEFNANGLSDVLVYINGKLYVEGSTTIDSTNITLKVQYDNNDITLTEKDVELIINAFEKPQTSNKGTGCSFGLMVIGVIMASSMAVAIIIKKK